MLFTIFLAPAFLILFILNPIKNTRTAWVLLKINGKKCKAELADTSFKKSLGLMYRDVEKASIMIFIYKRPARPVYYNKNVKFPVRILFLSKTFNIVSDYIMPKNSFKIFRPSKSIYYVLEIPLYLNVPSKVDDILIDL